MLLACLTLLWRACDQQSLRVRALGPRLQAGHPSLLKLGLLQTCTSATTQRLRH